MFQLMLVYLYVHPYPEVQLDKKENGNDSVSCSTSGKTIKYLKNSPHKGNEKIV